MHTIFESTGRAVSRLDVDYESEMARRWLGIGNVEGKYWFCGLEPGGGRDPSWARYWYDTLNRAEVTDARQGAFASADAKWFQPGADLQPTWRSQIRVVLAFEEKPTDREACRAFQVNDFGRLDGSILSLELSAYPAQNLLVNVPRAQFRGERVTRMRSLLLNREPTFLVCYGFAGRNDFEKLVGGTFDADGFRWEGNTLCAITEHMVAWGKYADEWVAVGRELARRRHEKILQERKPGRGDG